MVLSLSTIKSKDLFRLIYSGIIGLLLCSKQTWKYSYYV